jgi:ankyrin repeat protein
MNEKRAYILIKICLEDLEKGSEIINKAPEMVHDRTGLGETPLHFFSVENHLEAVKLLHSKGAKINTVNECGGTPLSEAASLGYFEMVKYLLGNGAQIDGLFGTGDPIIHETIRSGNPDVVDLLVRHGADINARNSQNETSLHVAAENDEWLEVRKYLVGEGFNVNEIAAFNTTPLIAASLQGSIKTAMFLEKILGVKS